MIYKDLDRAALKTQSASVIKTYQLMPYREIIIVCPEISKNHTNALCWQNVEFLNVKSD
jgi:hypothetical protein